MGRTLKPQKVDEARHPKSRVVAEIMLDRNKLDFFAKIGTSEVRAETAAECKKLALEKLEETVRYVWEPIIAVLHENHRPNPRHHWRHDNDSDHTKAHIELKFRRLERSPSPTGRGFMERPHLLDLKDEWDHTKRENGSDISNYHVWDNYVVIPYTEEAWNGLLKLHASIEKANDQIEALLGEKDLVTRLISLGQGSLLFSFLLQRETEEV